MKSLKDSIWNQAGDKVRANVKDKVLIKAGRKVWLKVGSVILNNCLNNIAGIIK